jgi:ABC-type uncharacterized transport system involved in gliding motility auxiliary subunit
MTWLNSLNRTFLALGSVVAAAILLLAVNLFSAEMFRGDRLDLTEGKLFTIADGTKSLLKKIDEPIEVKLYFSEKIGDLSPAYRRYFEQVRGLLQRYSDLSGGKVQVISTNPEPFSDTEDRAVGAGLQAIPLGDSGETGYFGLVATNTTDNSEVIALLSPERQAFLEYTLSSIIYKLSNPQKKTIGYMAGVPIEGNFSPQGQVPPWRVLGQLRDFYDMRRVSMVHGKVEDGIDMLILFQPAGLIEEEVYAIDQFALSGKPVIVLADPNVEVQGQEVMRFATGEKLLEMLKTWGVELSHDKVIGDMDNARRIQFGAPGGQPEIAKYLLWQVFGLPNIDVDDPVFAGVSRLAFATPGPLLPVEGATTKFSPLVISSANSQIFDAVKAGQPDPQVLLDEFKSGGKPLNVAGRLRGTAKSVFGANAPTFKPAKTDDGEKPEPLPTHRPTGTINVVVVSDIDWLFDRFWVNVTQVLGQEIVQQIANNGDLLINLAENMLGGNELIGVRGRGVNERPFVYVQNLERAAEAKYRAQEQVLNAKLKGVQDKIAQMQVRDSAAGSAGAKDAEIILTKEDRKTLLSFRAEMIDVRRQLREVQRALRQDIERTEFWVKALNIAAVPLLIAIGGIIVLAMRRRRRRHIASPQTYAEAAT